MVLCRSLMSCDQSLIPDWSLLTSGSGSKTHFVEEICALNEFWPQRMTPPVDFEIQCKSL